MNNRCLIALLLISSILISGCGQEQIKEVSLTKTENVNKTEDQDVLKIGVAAMISPKNTLFVYQDILNHIGEHLGKRIVLVQRETYDEMNELVQTKEVIAAFVCSGPYVDGKEEFDMELIAAPQMYGENMYYSYIIVHTDSDIQSFEELRGKTFAFTDPGSNTGKLVPTYMLSKMGETPATFFEKYIYTGSHDNSIIAVSKKLVDGAAVDHLIWEYINRENPESTLKTKIIDKQGPYCIPPFVTHPDTDPKLKEQMRSILLNMHEDQHGREILDKIAIEKFVLVEDKCYDSVREMQDWIEQQENLSNTK